MFKAALELSAVLGRFVWRERRKDFWHHSSILEYEVYSIPACRISDFMFALRGPQIIATSYW